MGTARNWFNTVRKKFIKSSHQRDIVIPHSENLSQQSMIKEVRDFPNISPSSRSSFQTKNLTREDIAAIKIQSVFRGHLARRAYRALRSLVKLQAVARGAYVRKQVQIAMNCMHALVRLQVKVRARQLLAGHNLFHRKVSNTKTIRVLFSQDCKQQEKFKVIIQECDHDEQNSLEDPCYRLQKQKK
ncbi:hypothetical protein ERO13_A02G175100v2 [Gossypium hirsutum]|nr:hypothetical protein ERO13_A02G175100v2 [Gossypium hirsutum]